MFDKKVFHFSGGPSSGLMVLLTWQPGDLVIFCDTGREDKDTLRFVREFGEINNIPIVWLAGNWRKDVIIAEKMIPNYFKRKCTINLKIKMARRYLRSIGWFKYTQCVGFRYDEKDRVSGYGKRWKQVSTEFPLFDLKIEQPEVNLFWRGKEYRLTIPAILKNCDLCFQKGEAAIMAIIQHFPNTADKWIEDEEDKTINPKGYTYHKGKTMRQIRDNALALKKVYNLEEINPKYKCACTA